MLFLRSHFLSLIVSQPFVCAGRSCPASQGEPRNNQIFRRCGFVRSLSHPHTPLLPLCPAPELQTKAAALAPLQQHRSLGCARAWALLHGSEDRAALPGHRAGVSAHPTGIWSGCPDATSQRSSLWGVSRSLQCCVCCALISLLLPAVELVLLALPPSLFTRGRGLFSI